MKHTTLAACCISLIALCGCSRDKIDTVQAAGNTSAIAASSATLPAGTPLHVRLQESLDTHRNRAGDRFTATLDQPVVMGDRVVLPQGTMFDGHVTESKTSGHFKGRAVLAFRLDSFTVDGRTYDIRTNGAARASHKKHGLEWITGGSAGGAAIGAIAGGGSGALIGAGAGAAAGTAGSAFTGKRQVRLPAETLLRFTLVDPVTL